MNKKKLGLMGILVLLICFMLPLSAIGAPKKDGWYKSGKGWYYAKSGKNVTGWKTDKGRKFYLQKDKKGLMATKWLKIGSKWYYFEPVNSPVGAMKTGWVTVSGKKYYLSKSNGAMYTGKKKIGKTTYLFAASGELLRTITKPTWKTDSKGKWYDNGDGTYPKNGWKTISGKKYYFNKEGYLLVGWQKINNKSYYLGTNGAMVKKSWINSGGKKYYVGRDGVLVSCIWVGDKYVGADGYWIKEYQDNSKREDGWVGNNSTVRLNSNKSGAVNWRYFKNGRPLKGWQNINAKRYYFEADGYMRIGWLNKGNSRYFMNTTTTNIVGTMVKGWIRIDGQLYFFFNDGKMARSQTLRATDKKYYTFDSEGRCIKIA